MPSTHCYPGLLLWDDSVHVFGGYPTSAVETGKLCERMLLPSLRWEVLPALHHMRYCFNPVFWRAEAYLCGGFATSIEVFSGTAFRLLPLILPEKDSPVIVFCRGTDLVILSFNQIVSVSPALTLTRNLRTATILPFKLMGMPAVFGDTVFAVSEGRIYQFSLFTGQQCASYLA